jgi:pectate lyase-like protein
MRIDFSTDRCRLGIVAVLALVSVPLMQAIADVPPPAMTTDAANRVLPDARRNLNAYPAVNIKDPPFNAKGDGVTDDTAAINAAIAFAVSNGYAAVYFPSTPNGGYYLACNGITATAPSGLLLTSEGTAYATFIYCPSTTASLLTISGSRVFVRGIAFENDGFFTAPGTIGNIRLNACGECGLYDVVSVAGGNYGIDVTNGSYDAHLLNVKAAFAYGALVHVGGGSGISNIWGERLKLDQPYVANVPVAANFKGNWAAATAYSASDIVKANGFYFQYSAGGTSGSVAPTPVAYGVDVHDGSATCQITAPVFHAGIYFDTGASDFSWVVGTDISGSTVDGIYSSGTGIPVIEGNVISQNINSAVNIAAGSDGTSIVGNRMGGVGVGTGVIIGAGDSLIVDRNLVGGFATGIAVNASSNLQLNDNQIFGTTTGVAVAAGVGSFQIIGGNMGSSNALGTNTTPISVASGSSDYYIIMGVNTHGATNNIVDNGTGTHKVVTNNLH